MRHVFEKFQTKHALALAKTAETPITSVSQKKGISMADQVQSKKEADLLDEISRLKK